MRLFCFTLTGVLFVCTAFFSQAQTFEDALRFNRVSDPGHARSAGMMNASGAAGAQANTRMNPAGIALYRNSEVSGTLGMLTTGSSATYLEETQTDHDFGMNIPQISAVIHTPVSRFQDNGWINYNVGISFERQNSFHENTYFSGINESHSMTTALAESANGQLPEELPWIEYMAWDLFLIDNPEDETTYIGVVEDFEDPEDLAIEQSRQIERRGRNSHFNLTFAGNYNHRFYIGGALHIPRIKYRHSVEYTEANQSDQAEIYRGMTFRENNETSGLGVRASLGAVVRATDWLRLGLTYKSPGRFSMEDEYDYQMISRSTDEGTVAFEDPPEGQFSYKYTIPSEWSAMATLTAGDMGMLSFTLTTHDPSVMRFSADDHHYRETNQTIRDVYQRSYAFSTGVEIPIGIFALRGGYRYQTSPFQDVYQWTLDGGTQQGLSGGIGLRINDYTVDLTYMHYRFKEIHQPYELAEEAVIPAEIQINQNTLLLSASYRF